MAKKFHKYAFDDEAHEIIQSWIKKYKSFHNLPNSARVTVSDVIKDVKRSKE